MSLWAMAMVAAHRAVAVPMVATVSPAAGPSSKIGAVLATR